MTKRIKLQYDKATDKALKLKRKMDSSIISYLNKRGVFDLTDLMSLFDGLIGFNHKGKIIKLSVSDMSSKSRISKKISKIEKYRKSDKKSKGY